MKKIMVGVLIIALICITTGACAVLSQNITNDLSDNIISDIQANSQNSEEIQTDSNIEMESNIATQTASPEISNTKDVDKKVYVAKYAYYLESQALDDRYMICVNCGGFVPIGNVTTPLPDEALCHYGLWTFADDYRDYSISYEEAYNLWMGEYNQQPRNGPEVHGPDEGDPDYLLSLNTPYYGDILAQYEECASNADFEN